MDTKTVDSKLMVSLQSAIENDRRLVRAGQAAEAAAMEEKRDRFRLSSYHLQIIITLGLVITVLTTVVASP